MPYTVSQRFAIQQQLDALSMVINQYNQGVPPTTNIAGELAAMVVVSGAEQVETLDQLRAALITALQTSLAAWQAAE